MDQGDEKDRLLSDEDLGMELVDDNGPAKVTARNLPLSCSSDQINFVFSPYGEIVHLDILEGEAEITFRDRNSAVQAIHSLDGSYTMDGATEPLSIFFSQKKKWYHFQFSRANVILAFYLVAVILVGTGNRVSFKIMQNSIFNYTYFVSQLTTFIYIPVNGFACILKLLLTNDITPEMRAFPLRNFAVMGVLDSLAGLIIG